PTARLSSPSLHDALPIFAPTLLFFLFFIVALAVPLLLLVVVFRPRVRFRLPSRTRCQIETSKTNTQHHRMSTPRKLACAPFTCTDRKSTRLNSSHVKISY